jgi:hypothetical protein
MLCHKVGSVLGPSYFLELRYEDLVRDGEASLRRVCKFLEEPFAPEMLRYHEMAVDVVPTESLQWHQSSVQAPDPRKVYAWKQDMSLADRIIFEQTAGDALELFGYERENRPANLQSRLKGLYYCVVKRW